MNPHRAHPRRRVLGAATLATAALALAAKPAQAAQAEVQAGSQVETQADTPKAECLADLKGL